MRTAFQLLVFAAYMGALIWGGWYVFSGQMVADREAAVPASLTDTAPEDVESDGTGATPPTQP